MSTAIDWKALMRQEKAKAKKAASPSSSFAAFTSCKHVRKDLEQPLPGSVVNGINYISDWISAEEAMNLLQAIDGVAPSSWINLQSRRLQNLGGTPASEGMRAEAVPLFVQSVFEALVKAGVFPSESPPNHILLNEYKQGQGIDPHKDGTLFASRVAILSLGDEALIEFWPSANPKATPATVTLKVEDRSLLIFQGEAYTDYYHGILAHPHAAADAKCTTGSRRVSLTVRRVLNVRDTDSEVLVTAEQQREDQRTKMRFLMNITDDRQDLQKD